MSLGAVFPYSVSSLRERVRAITDKTQEVVHKSAQLGHDAATKIGQEAETRLDQVGGFITHQYEKHTTAASGDYSHLVSRKTRPQLVRISAAVCGIEFCYAAETAFVSPILLQIGVPVLYMTLIWCLSPLLGFFLVPLLGSCSDRCRWRIGRRRPFIMLLSVGILVGLVLVPNGTRIGELLGDDVDGLSRVIDEVNSTEPLRGTGKPDHRWGIVFTILGVILLDFDSDANQSPCRAYLLDVTVPEDHSAGLSTFTIMAGLGGSLGYVMGGVNWEATKLGEALGGHVHAVFTIVLILYLICVTLTLTSYKEIPLDELDVGVEVFQDRKKRKGNAKYTKFTNDDDDEDDVGYGDRRATDIFAPGEVHRDEKTQESVKDVNLAIDNSYRDANEGDAVGNETREQVTSSSKRPTAADDQSQEHVSMKTYLRSIVFMPHSLRILCLTNLFSWMSLVCYSLYFTDFVGQAVYGGDPTAPKNSEKHQIYEDGVRMGCWGMALYSISCSVYSFAIERLVKRYGAKRVYIIGQLVYTTGAIIMAATRNKVVVVLLSATAGVMYATLFTMPYLLVAHYHCNEVFKPLVDSDGKKKGQVRGLGTDIALISSMVFLAQFILSACMGGIVHAVGSTVAVIICAALLSFCGAVSATWVMYVDL
ncbi:PREDICTED: proton-associated sugar transporter A-like [Priapulus caudatus]|uniref:Proton-associated sugar transporter A-like n=1 Tax=Priapulus caudatus TaxID=37621 RepID=A0ABM1EGI2_PRICU|nr:PREDICTED: proton-associated sugar transporter A-like [Priapulus caudatus]